MNEPYISNNSGHLLSFKIADNEVKDSLPGIHIAPCFIDPASDSWVVYTRFDPNTTLPSHFHTGPVHVYTTSGSWYYLEHPTDVQTAGSYVYEPGGATHTFVTEEGAELFIVAQGANVNFEEDGSFINIQDATMITHMLEEACKANSHEMPKYVRSSGFRLA